MNKIIVVYWSQTGNTKMMAEAIREGIEEAGKQAEVLDVINASINDLKETKVFALGCPAMGDEVLEESEMEPFVSAIEQFAAGKHIVLFGSYGWGDGQWMRDWEERMKNAKAIILNGRGIIVQETPEAEGLKQCKEAGKQLASLS